MNIYPIRHSELVFALRDGHFFARYRVIGDPTESLPTTAFLMDCVNVRTNETVSPTFEMKEQAAAIAKRWREIYDANSPQAQFVAGLHEGKVS
jgi:hypothetical protein